MHDAVIKFSTFGFRYIKASFKTFGKLTRVVNVQRRWIGRITKREKLLLSSDYRRGSAGVIIRYIDQPLFLGKYIVSTMTLCTCASMMVLQRVQGLPACLQRLIGPLAL